MPLSKFDLAAICEDGWQAADQGRKLAANPYLNDVELNRLDAWIEGRNERSQGPTTKYGTRLHEEGRRAALQGLHVLVCPYVADDLSTRADLWMEGYRSIAIGAATQSPRIHDDRAMRLVSVMMDAA